MGRQGLTPKAEEPEDEVEVIQAPEVIGRLDVIRWQPLVVGTTAARLPLSHTHGQQGIERQPLTDLIPVEAVDEALDQQTSLVGWQRACLGQLSSRQPDQLVQGTIGHRLDQGKAGRQDENTHRCLLPRRRRLNQVRLRVCIRV